MLSAWYFLSHWPVLCLQDSKTKTADFNAQLLTGMAGISIVILFTNELKQTQHQKNLCCLFAVSLTSKWIVKKYDQWFGLISRIENR